MEPHSPNNQILRLIRGTRWLTPQGQQKCYLEREDRRFGAEGMAIFLASNHHVLPAGPLVRAAIPKPHRMCAALNKRVCVIAQPCSPVKHFEVTASGSIQGIEKTRMGSARIRNLRFASNSQIFLN